MNLPMLIKLAGVRGENNMEQALAEALGSRPEIHQRRQPRPQRQMSGATRAHDAARSRELLIINKRGLHARASAKFVQTGRNVSTPRSPCRRTASTVGGTSIMGLMMLAASPGSSVLVSASGNQAAQALDALDELIQNRFGEEM